MYLITVSVFLYTLFYTPWQIGAFEWLDSLPNGTQLEVCEGSTATFSWGFRLAPGERVNNVSFYQQHGTPESQSGQGDGMGTHIDSTDPLFIFTPDHQMIINSVTANDTGNYVLKVMVVPAEESKAQPHVTRASLLVKVSPVLEEGSHSVQAKLQPQAVKVTDGPQPGWHAELSCGTFLSLGQPAATITWTTPSGTVLPSTSYENGVFSLIIPNPVESGDFSCQIDSRTLECVGYKSSLRHQSDVRVDATDARVVLLEASVTELTARDIAQTARDTERTASDNKLTARLENLEASVPPTVCKASQKRYPLSGVRTLIIDLNPVQVYCDQDTDDGGWTVIQRRENGQVNFYRGWDQYVRGFGDPSKEHWLGLENIYQLTSRAIYTLRVDLWDIDGARVYAQYDQFSLGGASDKYRLHISGYKGTAGDSMLNIGGWAVANKMAFTTYDRDNDLWTGNCASSYHGAWWYNGCHHSHLNGQYFADGRAADSGLIWYSYRSDYRSFVRTEMKIRPRQ